MEDKKEVNQTQIMNDFIVGEGPSNHAESINLAIVGEGTLDIVNNLTLTTSSSEIVNQPPLIGYLNVLKALDEGSKAARVEWVDSYIKLVDGVIFLEKIDEAGNVRSSSIYAKSQDDLIAQDWYIIN
jgi:hypothetical protein